MRGKKFLGIISIFGLLVSSGVQSLDFESQSETFEIQNQNILQGTLYRGKRSTGRSCSIQFMGVMFNRQRPGCFSMGIAPLTQELKTEETSIITVSTSVTRIKANREYCESQYLGNDSQGYYLQARGLRNPNVRISLTVSNQHKILSYNKQHLKTFGIENYSCQGLRALY